VAADTDTEAELSCSGAVWDFGVRGMKPNPRKRVILNSPKS
jgi:hypothetical protein